MPGAYVVYLDRLALLALANQLVDYLLLWATSEVARARTTRWRLLAGAGLGTLHFVLFELARQAVIPYYGALRFVPLILLLPLAMLAVTFAPCPARRLVTVTGTFYGIAFAGAGAGLGAGFLLGSGQGFNPLAGYLAAAAAILVVAELGWGILQRGIWEHLYQVPLEVAFGAQRLAVNALVDTGNRLQDPLSGAPVIVLEARALRDVLPAELLPLAAAQEGYDLSTVSRLVASSSWSARFRVIPFASIGREHGLLVGFRPDAVKVWIEGRPLAVKDVVIGLYHRALDPERAYQALVHPQVVQAALASGGPGRAGSVEKGGKAHATGHPSL